MILMVVYVGLVVVAELIAFVIAQIVDPIVPATWSMLVFMGLFFGVLWLAWPLAVYITEKWLIPAEEAAR